MTDSSRPSGLRPLPVRAAIVLSVAVVAGLGGWAWIRAPGSAVSTDDAYIRADKTFVSPKVRGMVSEVPVAENQAVRAGDVLATIDPEEYDTRLTAARGDLMAAQAGEKAARAGLGRLDAEETLAKSTIDAAKALAGDKGATDPVLRQAFEAARGQELVAARSRGEIAAALSQAQAAEFRAKAQLTGATLDKANTLVRAPVDGIVTDRQVSPGTLVQPGVRLMTIVRPSTLYVTANFKETQTGRMVAGQPVAIRVDALPGRKFTGKVASLAPGTGSEFALLPFEPGAGNFTKIVQRVPVRITLDPGQPEVARLRPGLSAVVTVKVGKGS